MSSFTATATLLLIALGLLLRPPPAAAARESLTRGAAIAVEDHATDFFVSLDGMFASGFYNVSSTVFAVSVWFARAADCTVVWTAAPARLALDRHGGALVLTDYDGEVVWNATAGTAASQARLDNTGNLVLEDAGDNTVWQSFDSPTDTLLPAQRFTAARRLVSRGGRGPTDTTASV